ncbi:MAG: hypothetical protein A2901_08770 [Elusimicrobia bacterium RIFCSPLOWO2_01_FULL_54_10]|nr:MAG: hypothetical protein A2901_08770 [Elusimicrobia bacterium RIFCSPLOWO2_01_FULL_54_10]
MSDSIKLLLIEDHPDYITILQQFIAGEPDSPFEFHSAGTLAEGLGYLAGNVAHIILLDLSLPDSEGLSTLTQVRSQAPNVPVVVLTGGAEDLGTLAIRDGAQDYLNKEDLNADVLNRMIRYALERHRERKESEEKLVRINEELKRVDALKTTFITNVSHELRTPLTVITSAVCNLLEHAFGPLNEMQEKWINKIGIHSHRLNDLISDILDLSKLEAGKVELKREPVDFQEMVESLISHMQILTQPKQIRLTAVCSESLSQAKILIHRGRIEQVLTNLIANSIKFTPQGGTIHVSASKEHQFVEASVRDSGPGIPPEYLQQIFDRFKQVPGHEEGGKTKKGVGLGLAICKEIVAQHSGRIWAESQWGSGSSFIFRLPLDPATLLPEPKSILIVDDDEEICELLATMLKRLGHRVQTCPDGEQAIELAKKSKDSLDLIFLDLMLPGKSGLEVVRAIRSNNPHTQIAIVTAYPNSALLFETMKFTPLTIIAKPFNPEHIQDTLARCPPRRPHDGT